MSISLEVGGRSRVYRSKLERWGGGALVLGLALLGLVVAMI